jgi:hypothetical protein
VLFSGTEPAPWTQADDFLTDASEIWGFGHRLETFFGAFQSSWDNIGIPGAPSSVDGLLPPFGPSQQLSTANTDCTGVPGSNGFYHNCHVVDGWMPPPLPDGTPFFEYAWLELFRLETAPGVPAFDGMGISTLVLGLFCLGLRASRGNEKRGAVARRPASLRRNRSCPKPH